jgi:hypothetical protein
MDIDYVLIIVILILIFLNMKSKKDKFDNISPNLSAQDSIKVVGYAASNYMDNYKYLLIDERQNPITLFNAVNLFHPGDLVCISRDNKWIPVAEVISIMEIDKAFAVLVMDRPLEISGEKIASMSSFNPSIKVYPDIIRTPVHEIASISRYVVGSI